jgi:hypothetical protein
MKNNKAKNRTNKSENIIHTKFSIGRKMKNNWIPILVRLLHGLCRGEVEKEERDARLMKAVRMMDCL